ncbi:hypothetical protein [Streptomyces sp. NPDC050264]|uniref:hypothetical protein n=1 Tax=Streptomyces sp. NPDC050264 TaxID=3155038 RepID=UPI003425DC75
MGEFDGGAVTSVSGNGTCSFTEPNRDSITLLTGLGVEGDVRLPTEPYRPLEKV